jgi:predicted Zn-dependent protease
MSKHSLPLASIAVLSLLSACTVVRPPPTFGQPGAPAPPPAPGAQTSPVPAEEQATPVPTPGVEGGQPAAPKQFRLGTAASALVAQSHQQASGGNYQAAGATLERALRIEPENPLLYIELGQVRIQEGNAPQADGFGHKALALATGDPQAQAQAWRLIADSLRAQGKDPEAADAERHADALAPR